MTRHSASLTPDYFASFYADSPDPWRFATSDYERAKYDATLASLPKERYRSGLEIGCSIGVLTRRLAERCDSLIATDVIQTALDSARATCSDRPNVTFELGAIPADWPEGRFDLILLSEVVYFLDWADHARLVRRVEDSLLPGGDVVMVHWLGETHFPLSADEAADGFMAAAAFAHPVRRERTEKYRLDVVTREP